MDIWKLDTQQDIFDWFKLLSQDIRKNNCAFFHYNDNQLKKYLDNPNRELKKRFKTFECYWQHFNKKKRQAQLFLKKREVCYPDIFNQSDRIIIDEIHINFEDILNQINANLAQNKPISKEYFTLISKLIKQILVEQVFINGKNLTLLKVNLQKNEIYTQFTYNAKDYTHTYKLQKFLLKYQNLNQSYKYCNAWLVVSKNWQDILLQSTFKQWTSCMNLINNYSDKLVDNSCINRNKKW